MKSEQEIKEMLEKVEADERLHYPPATIQINAPLALIQLELETKQRILKWVLSK